jgi:IS4 transposase
VAQSKSPLVKPTPEEIMPIYQELLPRQKIKKLVKQAGVRLYWRMLTPLVMVWGFIFPRLNPDHSCDAAVSHLHSGAVDNLDPEDEEVDPLSKRLKSESSSAYVQGRNRLPLLVLQTLLIYSADVIRGWLARNSQLSAGTDTGSSKTEKGTWKGLLVRLLDGTTFRLRPYGDLAETYGQADNQHGPSYWVIVRSVAAFCLSSLSVVAYTEGKTSVSEKAMVKAVMEQDPVEGSLYLGDQGFGVYRTAQVARELKKEVLLRVETKIAKALQKRNGVQRYLKPGEERHLVWAPTASNKIEPGCSVEPIEGRLIYARVEKDGFRPVDIYLFTTLLDEEIYPAAEIVALYGQRIQVEIDYRHLKTTLEMEEFDVKSVAMFRKELAAGLLTYNLICGFMVKAALLADLRPSQLSFSRCWRLIREVLIQGVPRWVYEEGKVFLYLLKRLAKCKLVYQPNKVRYEPRKVRRRPAIFPLLKGDRNAARQEFLNQFSPHPNS